VNIEDQQIRLAYEEEHMSPSSIAEDRGLDELAVKAKLMSISSIYRKDCKLEPTDQDRLNFTDNQLETINQVIFETAISAVDVDGNVDFRTRLDAAKYIRNDKKGRLEAAKMLSGNTFNILSLNESLAQARDGAKKLKEAIGV
jgi:hypothetical protein